jgi:PHD/YefM family antitoxin component YafN of YafNO toxin-antitoxin module
LIAPLSDLRVRQAEILAKAGQGPVILLERGSRPALVVVTPELWNAMAEHVENLEDMVATYRARWELATGRDELVDVTPETVEEWLSDDLPAADLPKNAA